jgi:hypothetical protein
MLDELEQALIDVPRQRRDSICEREARKYRGC